MAKKKKTELAKQAPLWERIIDKLKEEMRLKGRPCGDIRVSIEGADAMAKYMVDKFGEEYIRNLCGTDDINAIIQWEGRPVVGDNKLTDDEVVYRGMKIASTEVKNVTGTRRGETENEIHRGGQPMQHHDRRRSRHGERLEGGEADPNGKRIR
jgi:hypothetical protein